MEKNKEKAAGPAEPLKTSDKAKEKGEGPAEPLKIPEKVKEKAAGPTEPLKVSDKAKEKGEGPAEPMKIPEKAKEKAAGPAEPLKISDKAKEKEGAAEPLKVLEKPKEKVAGSAEPLKISQEATSTPQESTDASQAQNAEPTMEPTTSNNQAETLPKPEDIRKESTASQDPNAPPQQANDTGPKSCCARTWKRFFNFFANDRIHGSIVGPHPVSFLCCCRCCPRCNPECIRPFTYASMSTKVQYFIMVIVVIIFSCFFIVPSAESIYLVDIADFFPCKGKTVSSVWDDCKGHGGYFMVYRNFFAMNFYFLCMAFTMIGVKSTTENTLRKKMHHGFWMYKYLILVGLLFVSYLGIRVEGGGIFEIIMMWLCLLCTVFFSVVQLVLFLDLLDLGMAKNQKQSRRKKQAVYGTAVGFLTVINLLILGSLCAFYTMPLYLFPKDADEYFHGLNLEIFVKAANLHIGDTKICIFNIICIVYLSVISVIILAFTIIFLKRLPEGSLIESLCVILYNLILIWSAMENQENFSCRPFWREWFSKKLQVGNMDTYFKLEGCFHGIAALLALYYYVFWHGPRSSTAPLSIAFVRIINRYSKRSEVPVLSDNRPTKEHLEAQEKFKVWDDEQLGVTYSWSMFYVFLITGSMTICGAMTNFSDPWATLPMSSSAPAIYIKLSVSVLTIGAYLWPILLPKSRCIRPDDDI